MSADIKEQARQLSKRFKYSRPDIADAIAQYADRIEELESLFDTRTRQYDDMVKIAGKRIEELEDEVETLSAAVSNAIGDGAMAVTAERERIINRVKALGPGNPTGGGDYDEWTMEDVIDAIRGETDE